MYLETHRCVKCNKELPREEVIVQSRYKRDDGFEGVSYVCNPCNTNRLKKYRMSEHGKQNVYNAVYRSIKKHAKKQNARVILNQNVRSGKIIRPKICPICEENPKVEGHHTDYSKPLDVVWCCRNCHRLLDREALK